MIHGCQFQMVALDLLKLLAAVGSLPYYDAKEIGIERGPFSFASPLLRSKYCGSTTAPLFTKTTDACIYNYSFVRLEIKNWSIS